VALAIAVAAAGWTATGHDDGQVTAAGLQAPSGLDCEFLPFFRARLEWTASPSLGVEGNRIYHRGPFRDVFSVLDEVPAPSTTYDELRPSFLSHRYFVTAFLQSWESDPSDTIEVHCRPRLFTFPGPCDLKAENHHSQRLIEVTWEEVANAASYAVLRATTSGGPYDIVGTTPVTTYSDAAVSEGVTYYYLVVALDAEGNESDPSQEVAVPDAPSSPTPSPVASIPPEGEAEPEPEEAGPDRSEGGTGEAGLAARQEPPPTPPMRTVEYQVQPGDTLTDIAARFGTTVGALTQINGLEDPNAILCGSTLIVPYVGGELGGVTAGVSP
jgi:LysM repeat protein